MFEAAVILGAWDTAVLGSSHFSLSFALLIVIADPVCMGLLPVEEYQKVRITYAILDVGSLGCMAMPFFIILPSLAPKLCSLKTGDVKHRHI